MRICLNHSHGAGPNRRDGTEVHANAQSHLALPPRTPRQDAHADDASPHKVATSSLVELYDRKGNLVRCVLKSMYSKPSVPIMYRPRYA